MLDICVDVKLQGNLTIPAMQTRKILGVVDIQHHIKRIYVTTEAVPSDLNKRGFEAIDAYAVLNGGSNRVVMAIRNVTRQKILRKGQ